ncbi:TolC family protein [uncultured Rikenella sp.]|uniref:TolC family protein n=1 Tax=uncultured Rikenella sp. TaxID=368003 RepID=UPI0026175A56|nr:TolC family protein [uncultured Rikenella sp.]
MKKILYHIAVLSFAALAGRVSAQTGDYASFLNEVASRSPQLAAAGKEHAAAVRGLRTGLAPDDPEVALEYYFAGETRYEIAVEQAFDFPTVYRQRNKISKLGISKAEQEYRSARRNIMAAVSDAYLNLNYASERVAILTRRRDDIRQVIRLYEEGMEAGQITAIETQNARMLLTEVENSLVLAETEREETAAVLAQLNGGSEIAPQGYPQFGFTGTQEEFVAAALAADYELQAAAIDTLIAQRELKLSRNEWLPKLKIGYKAEVEGSKGTNALLAGISLPLWQNSGRTRHAKALGEAAKAQHAAAKAEACTRLSSLYARYRTLAAALAARQKDYLTAGYPELLKSAAEAGKITSIDALMGLGEWYTLKDSLMALEYEVALAGAAMALCLI